MSSLFILYTPIDCSAEHEFYLIDAAEKEKEIEKYMSRVKDIDEELEITTLKLAKLLAAKEEQLKQQVIENK